MHLRFEQHPRGLPGGSPPHPEQIPPSRQRPPERSLHQAIATAFARRRPEVIGAGKSLFIEGDEGSDLFLLDSGTMVYSRFLPDGRRMINGFALRNDIFSLTLDGIQVLTVDALEESRVRRLPQSEIADVGSDAARHLTAQLRREPWAIQNEMLLYLHKDADESISYFILRLAERLVGQVRSGTQFRIAMSRVDIADYLGLTVETVCRGIRRLRHDGIIEAGGPHNIMVKDARQLRSRAGLSSALETFAVG